MGSLVGASEELRKHGGLDSHANDYAVFSLHLHVEARNDTHAR